MLNSKQKKKAPEHTQSFAAGQIATAITANHANATDKMVEGMDIFREVSEATGGNPVKHGNLFECIEAAKFNVDAALKGSSLNAQVTASPADPTFPKDPHHPVDIVIRDGDEVVRNVQSKAYEDPSSAAFALKEEKYFGMDRLVPEDKEPEVRDLLDNRAESGLINADAYGDAQENLQSELNHGDVTSDGTTYKEAIYAKDHSGLYTMRMELGQLGEEIGASAGAAGTAGFIIGGVISAVKNFMKVKEGHIDPETAIIHSTKSAIKVGIKGATIGGTGAVIRFGGEKAGLETLSKSNVATAIAAGILNTGVTIYSLVKGEIDTGTAMERLGQTSVCTVYGLFAGSAVGVVFTGPAVAAAATVAGYLLANSAYQSCIAILKDAKLAEEKANLVSMICQQAVEEMKIQRKLFESQIDKHLKQYKRNISQCLNAIDKSKGPEITLNALSDFACLFGKHLRFEHYDDFDKFMQQPNSRLTI